MKEWIVAVARIVISILNFKLSIQPCYKMSRLLISLLLFSFYPCLVPSLWASLGFRFTFFSVRDVVQQSVEIKQMKAFCDMTPCVQTHNLRWISCLFSDNFPEDVGGEMSLRNIGYLYTGLYGGRTPSCCWPLPWDPLDLAELPLVCSTQYRVFHSQTECSTHPAGLLMYYERRPKCWGGNLSQCCILHLGFMVD